MALILSQNCDLFQVVCSECDNVSVTYEPFMYLSLPIPYAMERQICEYLCVLVRVHVHMCMGMCSAFERECVCVCVCACVCVCVCMCVCVCVCEKVLRVGFTI